MNGEVWVYGVAICISGLLVFLEWRRKSARRPLRIVGLLVAIVSLFFIWLKPKVTSYFSPSELIILTPGYDQGTLDSLRNAMPKSSVANWDSMDHDHLQYKQLYLLGYGIPEYDLYQFKNQPVHYHPAKPPAGIVKLQWLDQVTVGQDILISGVFNHAGPDTATIRLESFGRTRDSVRISSPGLHRFALKASTAAPGRFLYTLAFAVDEYTETREIVPVWVMPQKRYDILIINEFPSFETKTLKQFLSKKGHRVVVRTKVSRNIFNNEFINQPAVPGRELLSAKNLEEVDIIIIDLPAYQTLSKRNKREIDEAVNRGCGLLLQPSEAIFKNPILGLSFRYAERPNMQLRYGPHTFSLDSWSYRMNNDGLTSGTFTDDNDLEFGCYAYRGKGKIATTYFKNSYPLVLKGDTTAYARLWSSVLNRLVRSEVEFELKNYKNMVFIHEPVLWEMSSELLPQKVTYNSATLASKANPLLAHKSSWHMWPDTKGWNRLSVEWDHTTYEHWFFTFEQDHWTPKRNYERIMANIDYFQNDEIVDVDTISRSTSRVEPVKPLWSYLTFLLAMTFLWLEPKW